MDLKGRKIKQFRCHISPSIGGIPKQAFDMKHLDAYAEMTPAGIYYRGWVGQGFDKKLEEHVIPYTNVEHIKLEPEEPKKEKMNS